MPIINSLVSWYLKKRVPAIEKMMDKPHAVQEEQLMKLLRNAEKTEFGNIYDFKSINDYEAFRSRIPVVNYDGFKHNIERLMQGEQNIIWPSEVYWFAKSSGTTSDKSKFIPVTYESLDECHFQGGKDALLFYLLQNPNSNIFDGKGLIIGGSNTVNKMSNESFYGDLSAVMMQNMPFWAHFLRTPDLSIALMDNWDEKVQKMALSTLYENVTNMSGVPTWTIVLIEKLFELSGKNNVMDIWPNLELYVHGGVSFTPYQQKFKNLIRSSNVNYVETYNASEGFIGLQDNLKNNSLLLMLDYGIFFEFMPMSEYGKESPKCLSIAEVKKDETYALIISTNAGLWRYIIGDTIKFTELKPYRFKITGRTKHFINAFGEELMIENADYAINKACERTHASISDYTAAPIYFSANTSQKGGHEWLIEFDKEPVNINAFANELDQALKQSNSDYEAKRYMDMAMQKPIVKSMAKGTFRKWLQYKKKLGGQHKIPRLSNNREVIEEVLKMVY